MALFHFFFVFFFYSYISNINNYLFLFFLSITIRSGRLASFRLPHWIFMSLSTLISLFSTASSGACCVLLVFFLPVLFTNIPVNFLCNFVVSSFMFFSSQLFISACCVANFHLFSLTIYTGRFHWYYYYYCCYYCCCYY